MMTDTRRKYIKDDGDDLSVQIRKKAYEIFKDRAKEKGNEISDWLKAEKEIKDSKNKN